MYRTAAPPLRRTPVRKAAKAIEGRKFEALLAAGQLLSFFLPWVYPLGTPLRAGEIRDRLAGPHRLLSVFMQGSRVSADYRLSIGLYAVPIAAGLVLMLIALRRYRPWTGFLAGVIAIAAYLFMRGEVAGFPFHRMAPGSFLALGAGAGLASSPLLRAFIR